MEFLKHQALKDIAVSAPQTDLDTSLEHVGLERVQTMVTVAGRSLPAVAEAGVSLVAKGARGIHMSRLYRLVQQLDQQELSWAWLSRVVKDMRESQGELSDRASLQVRLDWPVQRQALKSGQPGWRTYPVSFSLSEAKGFRQASLSVRVLYSSTFPCSASLSQQAVGQAFAEVFREERLSRAQILAWLESPDSLVATAHAQRSEAHCELVFADPRQAGTPLNYIDLVEQTLGTAVQTAVKREDEQEFARLNAKNLMFCEDAARRLKAALSQRSELSDFTLEVRHFESLHPHDVVARARAD